VAATLIKNTSLSNQKVSLCGDLSGTAIVDTIERTRRTHFHRDRQDEQDFFLILFILSIPVKPVGVPMLEIKNLQTGKFDFDHRCDAPEATSG
jgi:hypothetical protein